MKTLLLFICMFVSFSVVFGQKTTTTSFLPYKEEGYPVAEFAELIRFDTTKTEAYVQEYTELGTEYGWIKGFKGVITIGNAVWLNQHLILSTDTWADGEALVAAMSGDTVCYVQRPSYSDRLKKTLGPEPVYKLDITAITGWKDEKGQAYPVVTVAVARCGQCWKRRTNPIYSEGPIVSKQQPTNPTTPAVQQTIPAGGTLVIYNINNQGASAQQPVQQPTQMQAQYETWYHDDGTQYQKLVGYVQIQSELYPIAGQQYVNANPQQQQQQQAQTVNVNVEQPKQKGLFWSTFAGTALGTLAGELLVGGGNNYYGGGYNACSYCGVVGCNGSCRWNQQTACGHCGRYGCNGSCWRPTQAVVTPAPNLYGDGWAWVSPGVHYIYPQ